LRSQTYTEPRNGIPPHRVVDQAFWGKDRGGTCCGQDKSGRRTRLRGVVVPGGGSVVFPLSKVNENLQRKITDGGQRKLTSGQKKKKKTNAQARRRERCAHSTSPSKGAELLFFTEDSWFESLPYRTTSVWGGA